MERHTMIEALKAYCEVNRVSVEQFIEILGEYFSCDTFAEIFNIVVKDTEEKAKLAITCRKDG